MNARIAVLPGDGIGPEVTAAALDVLRSIERLGGHKFDIEEALIGGAAIDATGEPLPRTTVETCQHADAVLLGAVGGPQWDDPQATVRPEQGLLGIRRELGLFANLRPVRPHPALLDATPFRADILRDVDMLVVRELTGGIYFGEMTRTSTPQGERATDLCVYTTTEIERVTRVAAQIARTRSSRITSVDKANVLETSRLWRSTVIRIVRDEFPDIELHHMLVDACAMHLIRRPADFDVILTENMFGDILTDEASMLAGSIGLLPSASIGDATNRAGLPRGMFEPIHGSAPDIAGSGRANPVGMILSTALLLRHSLGLDDEARAVEAAVSRTLQDGIVSADVPVPGAHSHSTRDVAAAICADVARSSIPAT